MNSHFFTAPFFWFEIKGSAGSMGTVKKATRYIKIKAPLGKQVSKH